MDLTEILVHKYAVAINFFSKTRQCPSSYLDEVCAKNNSCNDCFKHIVRPKYSKLYDCMFKDDFFKKYIIDNNIEPYIKITKDNPQAAQEFSEGKIIASYNNESGLLKVINFHDMNFETEPYFYIIRNIDNNYFCYVPVRAVF